MRGQGKTWCCVQMRYRLDAAVVAVEAEVEVEAEIEVEVEVEIVREGV